LSNFIDIVVIVELVSVFPLAAPCV